MGGAVAPFVNERNEMPRYDFLNSETGEIEEHSMSWKDLDQFKEDNPHLTQQLSVPNMISQHGSTLKRAGKEWENHLSRIKKNSAPSRGRRKNTVHD